MKESDKIDKNFRNLALIIVIIGILLLIIWLVIFINISHTTMPLLMSIAIALLIAGILLYTRIQYIIWMKKKY